MTGQSFYPLKGLRREQIEPFRDIGGGGFKFLRRDHFIGDAVVKGIPGGNALFQQQGFGATRTHQCG